MSSIAASADHDAFTVRPAAEFQEYADDTLSAMQQLLDDHRAGAVEGAELLAGLRRHGRDIIGIGISFGCSSMTLIARVLEDALADLRHPGRQDLQDIQQFIDCLQDVADGRLDIGIEADLLHLLPRRCGFEAAAGKQDGAVLLVMPYNASTRIVRLELQECGYRVVNVPTPYAAFEFAVRTQPDLVIASAALEDLSGVDLVCAMRAMPASRHLRLALLSSLPLDDGRLEHLPEGVPVVRRGEFFSDDFTAALAAVGLA